MDPNTQPVTKADLADLKVGLMAELIALGQRFEDRMDAQEQRFKDRMDAQDQRFEGRMDVQEQRIMENVGVMVRDAETRLLQAFYSFATANDLRVKQAELTAESVSGRMSALEVRVLELEKRLNMPPAA